jgi:voltage-gated potassium channel
MRPCGYPGVPAVILASVRRSQTEQYERAASFFETPLLIAAFLVIPTLVIEQSQPNASWSTIATSLNWIIWLAFLSEFTVLLCLTPNRRRWLREHPLDIAIVILTPPFLLSAFQPIRALRLLRLLRLVRLAQLSRRLFSLEGLRFVALLTLLTTLAGGAAFASVEKGTTVDDGMYWAVTTITTVGSHTEPNSATGKVLTIVLVIMGAAFVAILTGAIAQRFVTQTTTAAHDGTRAVTIAENAILEEIRSLSERLRRIEQALLIEAEHSGEAPEEAAGSQTMSS